MQYKFIDIYDSQDEIALPSEAMNFNGKFLENEILGYRTLYVSGRESLAPELEFLTEPEDTVKRLREDDSQKE